MAPEPKTKGTRHPLWLIPIAIGILITCPVVVRGIGLFTARSILGIVPLRMQASYSYQYELFKEAINWRQIDTRSMLALAENGTRAEIEPYVDYLVWMNADSEAMQQQEFDNLEFWLKNATQRGEYFKQWNPTAIADAKWMQYNCNVTRRACDKWAHLVGCYAGWYEEHTA